MSQEAVNYVTRHYTERPESVPVSTWMEAQAVLYFVAVLSDPSGHGCTASQTTIGERFGVRRQRVNELVAVLLESGALEKEPGRRAYIVAGVREHDPFRCGHPWCEKEAKTVFRMNARAKAKAKAKRPGSLETAAADAAFVASWAIEREAM